jgi:hypothetical protein
MTIRRNSARAGSALTNVYSGFGFIPPQVGFTIPVTEFNYASNVIPQGRRNSFYDVGGIVGLCTSCPCLTDVIGTGAASTLTSNALAGAGAWSWAGCSQASGNSSPTGFTWGTGLALDPADPSYGVRGVDYDMLTAAYENTANKWNMKVIPDTTSLTVSLQHPIACKVAAWPFESYRTGSPIASETAANAGSQTVSLTGLTSRTQYQVAVTCGTAQAFQSSAWTR